MDVHGGTEIHLQPVENSALEQHPGRSCCLWKGAHAGENLLTGTLVLGRPMLEQAVPERLHPTKRIHFGEVREGLWQVPHKHAGAQKLHVEEGVVVL